MDLKRKLFIYDRKEVGILILLGVGVALFAFTLGLHLGKQVNPPSALNEHEASLKHEKENAVHSSAEVIPPRSEIAEEVKNVPGAIDDTLDQTLRDEVTQTGIKVSTPKPIEFPETVKVEKKKNEKQTTPKEEQPAKKEAIEDAKEATITKGETVPLKGEEKIEKNEEVLEKTIVSEKVIKDKKTPSIHYSLQVGSFQKREEAEPILQSYKDNGLSGEIKEAEVSGKGTWFRVLLGSYTAFSEAESAGKELIHGNKIKEFVVVKVK